MEKMSIEKLAAELPQMGKEEIREMLQKLTRKEIQEIAVLLGLTVPKSATKWQASELIAGHFACVRLHNDIVSGSRRN